MKRSSLNVESSMQKQRQADKLVELVWEKDEIVMRRPLLFPTTTTTAQVMKRPKYLLSTSSTPNHRNGLPLELFPHHELMYHHNHHHRLIDSHIVPDKDHVQHEYAAHDIIHNSRVPEGNCFSTGDDFDDKNPMTTKLQQVDQTPIARPFSHHDHVNVNSRQVPNYDSCCRSSDVQINQHNCNHKTRHGNSTRGAAGLLTFVTTTNFSTSTGRCAHHQLLDGRPAVVATTAMNSTVLLPKPKPKPKPKISSTTPNLDHDNPTAVLVPVYDIDDHHHSQADPSLASKSKQTHSSAESAKATNYTYSGATAKKKQVTDNKSYACCDEALIPSFSVCPNDPNTTTHDEDDSEPCPCANKSVEDEPQLRPPPSTSNKALRKAARRKGPATAERRRRDKINKKIRALQALIPNCNKVKKASILDDAIAYMKTLQLQLQHRMSMGTATGFLPPNPMMLAGNRAPPHLGTSFAQPPPSPTFQMLSFAPTAAAASFVPMNLAPLLLPVPSTISLSLSSSKNSNPSHLKHDHRVGINSNNMCGLIY